MALVAKSRKRREQERAQCFGEAAGKEVWKPRKEEGGFVQMPRVLVILSRGHQHAPLKPPHRVLLWALWSAAWDERMVTVDPEECAYILDLKDQRAGRTVQMYLQQLQDAGLIRLHSKFGATKVLLRDPYLVLEEWRRNGLIDEELLFHANGRIADFGGRQAEHDEDAAAASPAARADKVRPITTARVSRAS